MCAKYTTRNSSFFIYCPKYKTYDETSHNIHPKVAPEPLIYAESYDLSSLLMITGYNSQCINTYVLERLRAISTTWCTAYVSTVLLTIVFVDNIQLFNLGQYCEW